MATVILYPIDDVSVGHSVNPSGSNGYACINDTSPDDDSTYLYDETAGSLTSSSSSSKDSTVTVGDSTVTRKIYLQGLSYTVRHKKTNSNVTTSDLAVSCSVNGGSFSSAVTSSSTTSYANYTGTLSPSGLNTTYNSFADANIQLKLHSDITVSGKTDYGIRVTQAYLTATYLPIYNCSAFAVEGVSSVNVSASEVIEGNSCVFSATVMSGYKFVGWYSDSECTQVVSEDASYTAQSVSSDTVLYAKAALQYTINAVGDEYCSVSPESITEAIGKTVTFTCTPNDNMKEFVGWYSNPERTSLIASSNPYSFQVQTNTTIYAKCKLKYKMFVKINSSWVECSAVYKKINGEWVVQDNLDGLFDQTKNYRINEV